VSEEYISHVVSDSYFQTEVQEKGVPPHSYEATGGKTKKQQLMGRTKIRCRQKNQEKLDLSAKEPLHSAHWISIGWLACEHASATVFNGSLKSRKIKSSECWYELPIRPERPSTLLEFSSSVDVKLISH